MTDPGDGHPFGLSLMREPGDGGGRRLRPAPLSSLFEIGFRILRRHWMVLLGVSLVAGGPAAILGAASTMPFASALLEVLPGPAATAPLSIDDMQARTLLDGLAVAALGSIVAGTLAAVAAVGCSHVVALDYHARPVRLGPVLRQALSRSIAALVAALLVGAATLGLMLAGVATVMVLLLLLAPGGPGGGGVGVFLAIVAGVAAALAVVTLSVRWSLVLAVVAVESAGPVSALRRSWHLTGEATWRTFAALVLVSLITSILGALVTQLLAIVVVDLVLAPMGLARVGEALVNTLVTVLFAPVLTVVMTVYLYDQKVRRDGWDLPPA